MNFRQAAELLIEGRIPVYDLDGGGVGRIYQMDDGTVMVEPIGGDPSYIGTDPFPLDDTEQPSNVGYPPGKLSDTDFEDFVAGTWGGPSGHNLRWVDDDELGRLGGDATRLRGMDLPDLPRPEHPEYDWIMKQRRRMMGRMTTTYHDPRPDGLRKADEEARRKFERRRILGLIKAGKTESLTLADINDLNPKDMLGLDMDDAFIIQKKLTAASGHGTNAIEAYRLLEFRLLEVRLKHDIEESPEEDAVLDDMECAWSKLSDKERSLLRKEGPRCWPRADAVSRKKRRKAAKELETKYGIKI